MRMTRFFLVVSAVVAAWVAEGSACGDKYLRIGKSMQSGRYVAIYPAPMLVYAPTNSTLARVRDLPGVLKRAGHSPVVVTDATALGTAMASGKYELVLAGLEHAQELATRKDRSASAPDVLPVLVKPTKAELAAAKILSSCVLNATGGHVNVALAEIDHRMELRRKAQGTAPRR